MAPDFWWLEGCFPGVFFGQREISNVYLIKDDRNLLLVGTGISPVMQEKILALCILKGGSTPTSRGHWVESGYR
jgi:hypothetical protein